VNHLTTGCVISWPTTKMTVGVDGPHDLNYYKQNSECSLCIWKKNLSSTFE